MAVEGKVHVCQAGEARRDIWGVACPFFLGSAAGLSPLCKCTGELHGLGLRPYAEKHLLPWLSPTAVPCFPARENVLDRSPGDGELDLEEHRWRWLLVRERGKQISNVKEEMWQPRCKPGLLWAEREGAARRDGA